MKTSTQHVTAMISGPVSLAEIGVTGDRVPHSPCIEVSSDKQNKGRTLSIPLNALIACARLSHQNNFVLSNFNFTWTLQDRVEI
jgi:hypothetical protein